MKKAVSILLALALVFSLAACGAGTGSGAKTSSPNASSSKADGETLTVCYSSIASSALAIWAGYLETNLKAQCDAHGWELKALSAEGNVELQGEQISQLISMKPDVMVIFPGDPAAAADWVETVSDAGIPCILVGQNVPEEARQYVTAFVGSDQREMCRKLVETMVEENGADAALNIVCISGVPVQQDYIDREGGLNDAVKELTNYNVLATEYAFSSRNEAKTIMEKYIATYGADGIDAVVAYEDDLLMGALQAIDEAGLTGKLKVYGVAPAMKEAMDAIAAGTVQTDVLMRTCDIMEMTADVIVKIAAGEKVEYMNEAPLYYITQSNVQDYMDKVEY